MLSPRASLLMWCLGFRFGFFFFIFSLSGLKFWSLESYQECPFGRMGDAFIFLSSLRKGKLGSSEHLSAALCLPVHVLHGGKPGPPRVPDPVRADRRQHLLRAAPPPQLADVQHQRGRNHLQPLRHHRSAQVTRPKGLGGGPGAGFRGAEAGWVKSRQVTTGMCNVPEPWDGEC